MEKLNDNEEEGKDPMVSITMKNNESINVKKKNKKIKKDKSEKHTLNEEKSSEEIGVVNTWCYI